MSNKSWTAQREVGQTAPTSRGFEIIDRKNTPARDEAHASAELYPVRLSYSRASHLGVYVRFFAPVPTAAFRVENVCEAQRRQRLLGTPSSWAQGQVACMDLLCPLWDGTTRRREASVAYREPGRATFVRAQKGLQCW